jgi:hypothetical protein
MADVVTTWAGREYSASDLGGVGEVQWETEWPFGCTKASWQVAMPPNSSLVNAARVGADVQIYDGPILTWGGYLSEFEVADDVWTFHATGYYRLAEHHLALDATGAPTSVPLTAVTEDIARGWNVTNLAALSSSPLSATSETVEFNTVRAVLDLAAEVLGQRWKIDEARRLTMAADPTTPRWFLDNGEALRSTADEDYLTAIYARFVLAVTGGEPTAWDVGSAENTPATANLRREQPLDLTPLGLTTEAAADAEAAARLSLAGTRHGYTSGLEIAYGDLVVSGGAPVRLGQVKAGEMLRAFNVADPAGQVALGLTQDIVIGRTSYTDGAETLAVTPVDLTPRSMSTILASPQAPPKPFEGSAA